MYRILLFFLLLMAVGIGQPAATFAQELPARPAPFRFVNDQAQLMSPADAKTLENGLRRYADKTGNQLVVVTVPTLGGRDVADYGRALGQAWGVGQRDKDNGIVVLLGAQEHKVTIQAGSGLRTQITPELTARVINQQMTPSFKQGNYFAGLRSGLNALMLAADPNPTQPAATAPASTANSSAGTGAAASASGSGLTDELPARASTPDPVSAPVPVSDPGSSGIGMGTLLLGALIIGGGLWLLIRMFRRKSAPTTTAPYPNQAPGGAPDFLPNQPNGPAGNYGRGMGGQPVAGGGPDFLPNRGNSGGGGGLGSGMGGILATGAAAAAGAYLGNRMAHGHDTPNASQYGADTPPAPLEPNSNAGAYTGGFPALGGTGGTEDTTPDYFADNGTDDSSDYFSSDYDDTSSDDTGGGGFDDDNSNSGEW
ncbi:TPM domain-containing protein [Hymenobacter wooponensis]|uniref:TPM domain-containing protein n=1 Tax=Hymenobacter wooponensis TaxID=1525360 RepID=A0A4Z0ME89_9BACT|nr:TPM domain-containing protein [Hymenobacter wooponensis]TGD77824.1 TPM domain-containing protein [Hymenobacter wooponensis]